MSYILTLVSRDRSLAQAHLDICERYLADESASTNNVFRADPEWLAPEKSIDLFIAQKPGRSQLTALRKELAQSGIDSFIVPEENRKKKLLIADMDSTILSCETLDEVAAALGLKDKVSEITEKAMRGELDFHDAIRERVAMLKDLPESEVLDVLGQMTFNPGAKEMVQTFRKTGMITILVSGGFTQFAEWAAVRCGFDHVHSNRLDIDAGKLTGRVREPILDGETKRDLLIHYARIYDISLEDTLAVGDGANDIKMLKQAGLGVGYQPKPKVAKSMANNIYQTDLMSLAYIQGYKDHDILSE